MENSIVNSINSEDEAIEVVERDPYNHHHHLHNHKKASKEYDEI